MRLDFNGISGGAWQYTLASKSIHDDNEDSTTIVIDSMLVFEFSPGYEFHLSPHSVTALRWQDASTGVGEDVQPGGFTLEAYPRAGGLVDIAYALPAGTGGTLEVRDLLGRRIASFPASGIRTQRWPAPAPGMYFLRLLTDTEQLTRKVAVYE